MNKKDIEIMKNSFDSARHYIAVDDKKVECWSARELQKLLGYSKWQNFSVAIKRAKDACITNNQNVDDYFQDSTVEVEIGSGTKRTLFDILLTRYACYLVAMNGDPQKDAIAFAQSYFATQARKMEILEERIQNLHRVGERHKLTNAETRLSKNIYERGVDDQGFGRIRSKGDRALFGGLSTKEMKERLGVKNKSRPLADFLPTVTIAAKTLATEMTNYNVEQNDLQGESDITDEHVTNNSTIRKMLGERGIKPEELPPAEDIKKVERKLNKDAKSISIANTFSDSKKKELV